MMAVSKNTKKTMKTVSGVIQVILNILFYMVVLIVLMRFSTAAYELSYQVFGNVTVQAAPGVDKEITIASGTSTLELASKLEEQGLIVNRYSFFIRAKISVSKSHPIMAGTYRLNTSMPYETILDIITGMEVKESGVEE